MGHSYRVAIKTGEHRGAGTNEPAWIRLVGDEGQTDIHEFNGNFKRGSHRFTEIQGPNVGTLEHVVIEHTNKAQHGAAWFLAEVEVKNVNTRARWRFNINKWLGGADSVTDPTYQTGRIKEVLYPDVVSTSTAMEEDRTVSLEMNAWCAPHHKKMADGQRATVGNQFGCAGEDAYFILPSRGGDVDFFGFADGVGQWRSQGIDPGIFSARLMTLCRDAAAAGFSADPSEVLASSWETLRAEAVPGSSTVGVCALHKDDHLLSGVNLGDSGFLVIRDGLVQYRTRQQEHFFGCPYQLGLTTRSEVDDADAYSVRVREGDIVIAGSDGLFDNLFEGEIIRALERHVSSKLPFSAFAQKLVRLAYDYSISPHKETPFSNAASAAYSRPRSGGNPDDITAIVARVVQEPPLTA